MKTCLPFALGSLLLLRASAASAVPIVLDFDTRDDGVTDIVHGEVLTDQYLPNFGVSVAGFNDWGPEDYAVAFDSTLTGTRDPDLEGPPPPGVWDGGNLVGVELGNLAIIQENSFDFDVSGIPLVVDKPDDEGRRPAGKIVIDFSTDMLHLEFDIVDREGDVEDGYVEFWDDGVTLNSINFEEFATFGSAHYDPTVVFGNNTANHISTIDLTAIGVTTFDRLVFRVGGSGAFDNITVNPIPEPGSAALFCAGALLVGFVLKRRAL